MRTLRDLDAAALSLAEISEQVITPNWTDEQVRTFLTEKQAKIIEAISTIYDLARPADDNYYQEIVARYPAVRRFFPSLLRTKEELADLAQKLDEAYRATAARFPQPGVRIEKVKNKAGQDIDTLVLTALEKIEEPESLQLLRQRVARRQLLIDLPELLLEIQARTNFASEFTHVSEARSRLDDLPVSICAVLIAEACNIGLTPMVHKGVADLERDRLLYVQQNYLRPETLSRANARLVDYQAQIPLAQAWGGGEVASADGLRFVVPLKTLNAGPNLKYFGTGSGITLVNYTSDQFSGFKNIVVTGTLRDSLVILEGLLNQETSLQPKELMTDTASYSDMIFGLFHVLGYQFSPCLADVGESRFWRIDADADYGTLNGLARSTINKNLIEQNWDDILRVAGSLNWSRAPGINGAVLFGFLGTIGVFLILVAYILTNVGAIRFFMARHLWTWQWVVPVAAIVVLGYTLYSNLYPAPAPPSNLLPYVALGWLLIGLIIIVGSPVLVRRISQHFQESEGLRIEEHAGPVPGESTDSTT